MAFLLARLTIAFFLIAFCKQSLHKDQIRLRIATLLVIIGSFAGLVLQIHALLGALNINILPSPVLIHHINVIRPWFSTIRSQNFDSVKGTHYGRLCITRP